MAAPGRMLADLRAALAEGMDGRQDRAEDPQSFHDALMAVIEARSGGAELVAEADGDGITSTTATWARRDGAMPAFPHDLGNTPLQRRCCTETTRPAVVSIRAGG